MIYNFYLFMILFSILSAIKIFLKKDILNCCHIFEEIIISSFLIFTITMFSYFVIMKQNMKSFWKRLLSNEDNFFWKILLFEVVFISGIMIGSYILQKEDVMRFGPWKPIGRLLMITLIAFFLLRNKLTYKKFAAILVILGGIYLLETSK